MLCACRNEHLWIKLMVLALAGVLALGTITFVAGRDVVAVPPERQSSNATEWTAIESNGLLVRRELTRGAVVVGLGTEMDQMEHRGLIESLKNPGCFVVEDPVPGELLALRSALRAELVRHVPSEVNRILQQLSEERLLDALNQAAENEGPIVFMMDEFRVEVGFATYHYWQVRVRPTEEKALLREKGERLIVLPCTKQAYVKLSLRTFPRISL